MRAAFEVEPYGHTRQCRAPVNDAYAPGVQRTQRNWPGFDLAKPARQRRSVASPPVRTTVSTPALGTATGRPAHVSTDACKVRKCERSRGITELPSTCRDFAHSVPMHSLRRCASRRLVANGTYSALR